MTTPPRAPSHLRPGRLPFSTHTLLLQLAVVALAVLLGAAVHLWRSYERLWEDAESTSLTLARSVASNPELRRLVEKISAGNGTPPASELATGPVMAIAESARASTGALFVVITDEKGLRLAHPDPERLGEMVSTDPETALSGREETTRNTGTLGPSAGAKVPLFAPAQASGPQVVGEVSVGFSRQGVVQGLGPDAAAVGLTAALSLAVGGAASLLLRRRLSRITLGLEPEQIGTLVQDQEAVLRGVDEGVIGISRLGRITVFNEAAGRLLGSPGLSGTDWASAPLAPTLKEITADDAQDGAGRELVAGERVLVVSARRVLHGKEELGWVVMLRDRTELQGLTRQLDAIGAMSEALRAQRHEFSNQLHTASGLLSLGETEQAAAYLQRLAATGPLSFPLEQAELLGDPSLQAFLGAKGIEAAERGVTLRLGAETLVRRPVAAPQDVTTVLGNLVDNAVRAAVAGTGGNDGRWVEAELLDDEDGTLHLVVADSGDGLDALAAADPSRVFEPGYSTAPGAAESPSGHGLGLHLARQLARRRSGDVWVISPGALGGPGAVFGARVPGRARPAIRDNDDSPSANAGGHPEEGR